MRSSGLFNYTADAALNRSLRNVLLAAMSGTVFFAAIQGSAYTAFVRALSKKDSLYGLLAALPLIAGVFRFASAFLIEKCRARRRVFLISLYLQRLIWIPFALIPFFIPAADPAFRVSLAILCVSLHGIGGAFGDVAFLSWLTDLVPNDIRGSYLGQRVQMTQIPIVLTPILAGWYLDAHPGFAGLSTVLIAAAVFGVADIALWHWVVHPSALPSGKPIGFKTMILEPLRLPSYRKLLFFWTATLFSFGFTGPYFMVYNLEVLHLSYTQASLQLQVIPGVVAFIMAAALGRGIDTNGSKPLLRLAMTVSAISPIFWILSTPAWPWLQTAANIFGGATWIALDMAQMNLMMKILPRENRAIYIAGYGLTAWLVGNATGVMLAGSLADLLRPWVAASGLTIFGTPLVAYQVLFAISLLLRWAIVLFVLPGIEEPEARSLRELASSLRSRGKMTKVSAAKTTF